MEYDHNKVRYSARNAERPPGKYRQKVALLKQMIREYVHVSLTVSFYISSCWDNEVKSILILKRIKHFQMKCVFLMIVSLNIKN